MTRELISQIILKYFRKDNPPKKALEQRDEVMALFDRDYVSKKRVREKLEAISEALEHSKSCDCQESGPGDVPDCDCGYKQYNKTLTDIKNLGILN